MKTPILRCFVAAMMIVGVIHSAAAKPHADAPKIAKKTAAVVDTPTSATMVHVESAWVRAAPPGTMMLAGYLSLRNGGKEAAQFAWAQSDAFGTVELHRTLVVDGVSTMRPAGNQTIPAGGVLRFEPGGLHLMLMQPQHALKVGDKVRFRLHFGDDSALDVVVPVSSEAPPTTTR